MKYILVRDTKYFIPDITILDDVKAVMRLCTSLAKTFTGNWYLTSTNIERADKRYDYLMYFEEK